MKEGIVPAVSVIIPTLNEEHYLPHLLESLRLSEHPMEIIVVDGNSTDDTHNVVADYAHRMQGTPVRFVTSGLRNVGAQRNQGASRASHALLMFLDADVIVPRDSFRNMVSEFLDSACDAANARFVAHSHERNILTNSIFVVARGFQRLMISRRPYFAGACILVHREAFFRVKGFNETILLGEDVDFAHRLSRVGKCGLLQTEISISMRRLKTLRYQQIWEIVRALPKFLWSGKVSPRLIAHYPFGHY